MEKVEATKLFAQFSEEINSMSADMFPIGQEIVKGETVVGTIEDDFLKKIWMLSLLHKRDAAILKVQSEYIKDSSEEVAQAVADAKADFFKELFWFLLKSQMNLFKERNSGGIGLRNEWKVVLLPEQKVPPFLKMLLGDQG